MLKGKIILVTGAAGRLGYRLIKDIISKSGKVVAIDTNLKKLKDIKSQFTSKKILTINADCTDPDEISEVIKKAKEYFGCINVAVHCAYPRSKKWGTKLENLEKKYLLEDIGNQLGGAILFSKKILSYFKTQKSGNLIHISSIQGIMAPKFEHYSDTNMVSPIEYSAIKAGIISITKYLSKYYKNNNIRVNCISPGGFLDNQPKNFLKKYKKSCNDKGMLNVGDVIGTLIFLISNESKYINGQNIIIDDGWSL